MKPVIAIVVSPRRGRTTREVFQEWVHQSIDCRRCPEHRPTIVRRKVGMVETEGIVYLCVSVDRLEEELCGRTIELFIWV
jgi:hypothetical protein